MIGAAILAALAAPAASVIRLRDADLRVGDVAIVAAGRGLTILRLPPGRRSAIVNADAVRMLVANRLPGQRFRLRRSTPLRLVCGDAGAKPVPAPRPAEPALAAGEPLTLLGLTGSVAIERPVVTLQPARPGRRVFVRTEDGEVLSARLGAAR